ncbi:MAG: SCO family protein [Deltaproteobacteria bacterium]|nr:MAG: SCO family protein [Deltaproteobacteria bacterium]
MRVLALTLLLSCGGLPDSQVQPPVPLPSQAALPADSLYTLDLPLTDSRGEVVELREFRGHPAVISMFYASCPMACPMLVGDVQRLEAQLGEDERQALRVVLVSLDPKRDDTEALADAAGRYGVDPERWVLARTDAEHVRVLAALLDIQYRDLPNGEMNHSSILTVLDRDGRAVARRDGLGADNAPLIAAIRKEVHDE